MRKVDPTIVFSQERHEAMLVRARTRRRMVIAAVLAVAIAAGGLIAIEVISRNQRQAEKSQTHDVILVDGNENVQAYIRLRFKTNCKQFLRLASLLACSRYREGIPNMACLVQLSRPSIVHICFRRKKSMSMLSQMSAISEEEVTNKQCSASGT